MRDVGSAHGSFEAATSLTRSPVALLIIAHPDDEAMFFAPLLIATRDEWRWRIICLSTGALKALVSRNTGHGQERPGLPQCRNCNAAREVN